MNRPADPVADRGAQIDAAFAVYSTELDKAQTEYHGRIDRAAEDLAATESQLFAEYRQRVMDIAGVEVEKTDEHSDNDPDA